MLNKNQKNTKTNFKKLSVVMRATTIHTIRNGMFIAGVAINKRINYRRILIFCFLLFISSG